MEPNTVQPAERERIQVYMEQPCTVSEQKLALNLLLWANKS